MSENSIQDNPGLRMPSGNALLLSTSPHIHAGRGVRSIMFKVILALLPAAVAGVWWFGMDGLRVLLLSVVFTVGAEFLWCALAKKPLSTIGDCSAALSGLLLGMNLPPNAAWWVCLIGGFLAMWLGKQIYGGLGHNLFNPVIVARVALLIALPAAMTSWNPAREISWLAPTYESTSCVPATDAVTTATPLGETKELINSGKITAAGGGFERWENRDSLMAYALGSKGGCVGETSGIALLLGGLFLIATGIIKWQIPVFYIATVMAITGLVNYFAPETTPNAIFHLLTGGLLIGAFFMATDTVTSPITTGGQVLFGIGCGVVTAVIRIWGNYPEGVSFSILLMNAATPLLDRACVLRPFGYVHRKGAKS